MSVFLDTGLYYALQNESDRNHDAAKRAFDEALRGRWGSPYTSDYVYDEAVTLVRTRSGRHDEAKIVGDRILGRNGFPAGVEVLFLTRDGFEAAVDAFQRFDDQPLSFTDAATIAQIERHDIDHVLAFDDDFDGIVARLDPETVAE